MNNYGLMDVESEEKLALRGVDVAVRIIGLLAETSLTQKYQNDTKGNLELAYTFPLPVGVTLLSFVVQLGERRFTGEVVPRRDAEVAYEKAIAEGNSAFRLQEIRSGLYSATLGNVMAGETVEITVAYAESLPWNGNSLRYRLPTTIAPRYGEPTGMQPWQRLQTSLQAEYPLRLTVAIAGELARSKISCPSHKVSFVLDNGALQLTLAEGATMDRDFVLELENEAVQSLGVRAFARDTYVAMLTLLPPLREGDQQNRDVVMVLDCSGSMQGDSLQLAKEGIQLALGSMQSNERFGIVAFGSNAIQFDKELLPANRKNLDMARRWIDFLGTMGGTELVQALDLALRFHKDQAMDILLLTDGEVWLPEDRLSVVQQKGIRIFTLGIGSAVAQDVVQKLADDTGGACELVAPTEDMSSRISRHFNRMRQPQMERLDIRWPGEPLWVAQPERACFAGDACTVFAAFADEPSGAVAASFAFAGQAVTAIEIPLLPETAAADAIVRIAAKQHLPQMPQVDRQAWAVNYQLMTEQTDYLIPVERADAEKALDFPELQVQPQMLPAGWGGSSTVHHAKHGGVRFSRSGLGGNSHFVDDIPAVCRRSSKTAELLDKPDNGYRAFIRRVRAEAKMKIFGGLPTTRILLATLALPKPLETLLNELAAANYSDDDIVRAFYQALIEHDGSVEFNEKSLRKIKAIVGESPLIPGLVSLILNVLNTLWRDRSDASLAARYDIPAFLRKHAD